MKVAEAQPIIKNWTKSEQPREKFRDKGAKSLSTSELLAIILRSGTKGNNAIDVGRKMLAVANNKLRGIDDLSLAALANIRGIGEAKAIIIKAAMELAQRREDESISETTKVVSSRDAHMVLRSDLSDLTHEEFWALYLNRGSRIILKKQISSGGINSTVVDPRLIFQLALEKKASSIILAHNHPSGNLQPSQADIDLTKRLISAGKLFDIQVVDHLILAGKNYCSFADSGLM